MPADDKDDGYY